MAILKLKMLKGARPSLKYSSPGFFHKSGLYVLVILELGEKIKNFDGLGLKIAVLYFLALSPTSQNILSVIGDGVKKF